MSVYTKLQAARVKLQSIDLKKSGHNKFSGYYYFELGDFLPNTQAIFLELGLCGVVSFSAELATLRIIDTEDLTEIVITSPMGSAALKGCHEVQNIGAVETYQRRYLWATAMEIVEHDALDATNGSEHASTKQTKAEPKKQQYPAGLSDDDMDNISLSMVESNDIHGLQKVFGAAYKKANEPQKAELKKAYDELKEKLTAKEAA